jgi:hypothetical protein
MEDSEMGKQKNEIGDDSVYEQYVRHSDILRNWFVAYGIGGVLLFLTKDSFFSKVPFDHIYTISKWFVFGVAAQVLLAFINKVYNFQLYINTIRKPEDSSLQERAKKVARNFYLIDFIFDLVTAACFSRATYLLFLAVSTMAA